MERFDANGDGRISLREFTRFAKGDFEQDVDDLAELVRREIKRLADSRRGRPDLRRAFREFDRNDSGKINRREFGDELERLGFSFGGAELTRLLDRFDVDGDGKINYREFARFADAPSDEHGTNRDDADEVFRRLRKLVRDAEDKGVSIREASSTSTRTARATSTKRAAARAAQARHGALEARGAAYAPLPRQALRLDQVRRLRTRCATAAAAATAARAARGHRPSHDDEEGAIRKLRREIQRLVENPRGAPDYKRVFREFDRDGNAHRPQRVPQGDERPAHRPLEPEPRA